MKKEEGGGFISITSGMPRTFLEWHVYGTVLGKSTLILQGLLRRQGEAQTTFWIRLYLYVCAFVCVSMSTHFCVCVCVRLFACVGSRREVRLVTVALVRWHLVQLLLHVCILA